MKLFNHLIVSALCLLMIGLYSCEENDKWSVVDGADPELFLNYEKISTEPGQKIVISGKAKDADGLSMISLTCKDLYLNKNIDLIQIYKEPKTEYDIDYSYVLSQNEIGDSFSILVTAIDVLGNKTSKTLTITLDADFFPPTFSVTPSSNLTVLIKEETAFTLRFSVEDNKAIDNIVVSIPEASYSNEIDAEETKSFEFAERITLPSTPGTYNLSITATDRAGQSTTAKSKITVSELPDFSKMYLTDVANVADLNSAIMGVPTLIDRVGEFQYRARYYNQTSNTEIFFIPQKTDFSPICFGLDPYDSNILTDDPETAKPFILTETEVYYDITFNTKDNSYSVSTYPISSATNKLPQPIGSDYYLDPGQPEFIVPFQIGLLGLPGAGGPSDVIILNQDAVNPNLFSATVNGLEAGTKLNFIIHNKHDWGWWDYCLYRVDNSDEPEKFIYGGADAPVKPADIWAKPEVKSSGNYIFWFDAHLERGKFVKAK